MGARAAWAALMYVVLFLAAVTDHAFCFIVPSPAGASFMRQTEGTSISNYDLKKEPFTFFQMRNHSDRLGSIDRPYMADFKFWRQVLCQIRESIVWSNDRSCNEIMNVWHSNWNTGCFSDVCNRQYALDYCRSLSVVRHLVSDERRHDVYKTWVLQQFITPQYENVRALQFSKSSFSRFRGPSGGFGGYRANFQLLLASFPQFVGGAFEGPRKPSNSDGGQRGDGSASVFKKLSDFNEREWDELIGGAVFFFGILIGFAYLIVGRNQTQEPDKKNGPDQ